MRRVTSVSFVLSALLLISISSAQQPAGTVVPDFIRYSGTLRDAQGTLPVPPTTAGVTFSIYQQQDGGAAVWMETQNVTTDASGNYSVLLGSTTATGLPSDLFSQQEQRWLGVQVQGQAEQPRVLLVSVPYAFKAHEAETLGGRSASDFVLANGANSAANRSGTGQAGSSGTNNLPATTTVGGLKSATSQGPTNFSGSTTDQIVGVTQSGTGVGVNASAPSKGVVGTATATSGTVIGVEGGSAGTGGYGVYGNASSSTGTTVGVKGNSSSTAGTGVRATETATSGDTLGISSYVASPSGIAALFNNAAGGKIISGQNNGVEKFSVDGSGNLNSAGGFNVSGMGTATAFNSTTAYQIVGYTVLSVSRFGYWMGNTLVGVDAGASTSGSSNTFSGYQAGYSNSTGCCNTFTGAGAGGSNTTGEQNVFSGETAGYDNTTGSYNMFSGMSAGFFNTTGSNNTIVGAFAGGYNNSSGSYNTFVGQGTGGRLLTGSSDVYIANAGPTAGTESNAIRVGAPYSTQQNGCPLGEPPPCGQNAAFIAGIYGSTVDNNGIPVYVDDNGQLGTVVSSLRFKEQVRDMGDSTSALMKLRPVTFLYRPEYSKGDRTLQYGLIAEEVAQVYPELVAYDNDGQAYSVRYQYITTMLLNEVQKQYHRAEAEAKLITVQAQKIGELEQRLSRLEALVGAQVKVAEGVTPSAGTSAEDRPVPAAPQIVVVAAPSHN